ncbi:hypothetical protein ACZ87_03432 [Candidatus Erwinia dacicola]|uniref:Uncharacterized protein n=1 Tax=Candidatus Erwinia dacicola TaxID=252393 RepID=A0A328TK30_9GAMM|nr:hypothetical protein ACZ87_03432 [Candidatus Erwinia dacicola]
MWGGVIILILIVYTSRTPTSFDWRGIGRNVGFDTRREKMI